MLQFLYSDPNHVFYYSNRPCKSLENALFIKVFSFELTEKMNLQQNSYPAHIVLKNTYQNQRISSSHPLSPACCGSWLALTTSPPTRPAGGEGVGGGEAVGAFLHSAGMFSWVSSTAWLVPNTVLQGNQLSFSKILSVTKL